MPCTDEHSASVAQYDHVIEHTEYGEQQRKSISQLDVIDQSEPSVVDQNESVAQHHDVIDQAEPCVFEQNE